MTAALERPVVEFEELSAGLVIAYTSDLRRVIGQREKLKMVERWRILAQGLLASDFRHQVSPAFRKLAVEAGYLCSDSVAFAVHPHRRRQ